MANKKATPGEFKVGENTVIHVPTGAEFFAYSGIDEIHLFRTSKLGCLLENGDDYAVDSVWKIARRLMCDRLKN